ncbi:hypothetical protein IMZ11_34495 [Microtetraspora sp. AC03309]|uniref:hypothetical protein n=1 Tax=Microtetraspora sp. AC03309 TaxID=2779376 RepID=UPI001E2EF25D|nr:hypothetical protein [Microtetraspora sp. AC03309]MCC5580740.1 hypothetical protein [Microtetraspora sp. AC03309]
MRSAKLTLALVSIAASASLVACGGSSSDGASDTAASPAAATNGKTGKVSANNAAENEITAALQAAGVSNPDRWAKEVMENRPYAADDTKLSSLRKNLAKQKPGQKTIDKIISALTVP